MSSKSPRRMRNLWSNEETETLKKAVVKYGKKWKLIHNEYSIFKKNNRTQIDLKDKWRNICRKEETNYSKCDGGYIIFTKKGCDYCIKAKELVRKYKEINVDEKNINIVYNLIDSFTNKYRKFPIIFESTNIGEGESNIVNAIKKSKFIGGFQDLQKIYNQK